MRAIRVENISKRYAIGGHRPAFDTLRERLSAAFRNPFRRGEPDRGGAEPFWALRDVGFEVARGEVVGVIGRNGSGKSTLLKILSRITEPTRGRVLLDGRVGSLLEVGTGFHPDLTGRENVFLNGAVLGMSRTEIRRKFDEIVAFSEVERFLDTPVKHYSSGMYVRLAFAVAAHLESEVLLVDEVLAVGDQAFQKKCLGKMEDVGRHGRTILFVSHNMGAVKALCGRAILLRGGVLEFDGDVLSAASRYMGARELDVGVVRWSAEGAPFIPSARLLEVELLSGGKRAATGLSTEEPIRVSIRFEVLAEACVGTTVILHNDDGVHVFSSISNHEKEWHGRPRPAGIYRSECEIPADFLADGGYAVSIGLWEGAFTAGIVERDVLRFTAHDRGRVRGDLPYPIRGPVTMPLFPWRSEREG